MKKEMHKPLAFGIVMIICFSVLLSVGAFFVINSEKDETSFQKEPSFNIDSILNSDLPPAQKEMMIKYSVYNHVDESGKVLKLFSDEQSKSFQKRKKKGERFYLTYDEVLFLINDSIRLYNNYDEIILTDAKDIGIIASDDSRSSHTIKTYHGDFSEFDYNKATREYRHMCVDIATIIEYRVAMLDSNLMSVKYKTYYYSGVYGMRIDAEVYDLAHKYKILLSPESGEGSTVESVMLDEGKIESKDEYKEILSKRLSGSYHSGKFYNEYGQNETEPIIVTFSLSTYYWQDKNTNIIVQDSDPKIYGGPKTEQLFPTAELNERKPIWELKPSYFDTDKMTVSLVKGRGMISKTEINDKNEIDRLLSLIDRETVVNSNTDCSPIYIPPNEYVYKVDLMNGTAIYLPANDKFENFAAIVDPSGQNKASSISPTNFEYKMTKAFCEKIREMFSSELAEQLNNDPDYRSIPPYLLEKFEDIPSEYYVLFYSLIAEYTNDIKSKWSYSDNYKLLFESTQTLTNLVSSHNDYALLALRLSYTDFEDKEFFVQAIAQNAFVKAWCDANDKHTYEDIKNELTQNFEKYFK